MWLNIKPIYLCMMYLWFTGGAQSNIVSCYWFGNSFVCSEASDTHDKTAGLSQSITNSHRLQFQSMSHSITISNISQLTIFYSKYIICDKSLIQSANICYQVDMQTIKVTLRYLTLAICSQLAIQLVTISFAACLGYRLLAVSHWSCF